MARGGQLTDMSIRRESPEDQETGILPRCGGGGKRAPSETEEDRVRESEPFAWEIWKESYRGGNIGGLVQ